MPHLVYRIESDTITLQSTQAKTDGDYVYEREEDQVYYRLKLSKDLFFRGSGFTALIALEANICEVVTLTVEMLCGGEFTPWWAGKFTLQSADIDVARCGLRVRPDVEDAYSCLKLGESISHIFFDLDVVSVQPYGIVGAYEVTPIYADSFGPDPSLLDYSFPPNPLEWCHIPEFDEIVAGFDIHTAEEGYFRRNSWHRVKASGTCDGGTPVEPPGGFFTWNLLENNCPTDSLWWRCPGNENDALAAYNFGREFGDVVTFLVDELGCQLTVVSDFFGINPDDTAPSNAAYDFADLYLKELQIHQKSNIKRPYASDPARRSTYTMSLADLLHDIRVLLNVYYTISDEGILRLEHASYFTATAGLSLLGRPMKKRYKNDFASLPKRETYRFQDELCSEDFESQEIEYPCGKDDKPYRLRLFSTDLVFIQDIENQDAITDSGFVLIATKTTGDIRHVIEENRPLSWPAVHEALHPWFKAYPQATINGLLTDMNTWRRHRRAQPMQITLCCNETFNPEQLPETDLGIAEVESAARNPDRNTLTLTLRY